jgi:hypothetical protein
VTTRWSGSDVAPGVHHGVSWARLTYHRADEERGRGGGEAAVVIEQGRTVQTGTASEFSQQVILGHDVQAAGTPAVDQLQISELANRLDHFDAAMLEFAR